MGYCFCAHGAADGQASLSVSDLRSKIRLLSVRQLLQIFCLLNSAEEGLVKVGVLSFLTFLLHFLARVISQCALQPQQVTAE